jgi:hypothetical protein
VRKTVCWRLEHVHTQGLPDDIGWLAWRGRAAAGEIAGIAMPAAANDCGRSRYRINALHPVNHAGVHLLDVAISGPFPLGKLRSI